jgi:8-oxo-dGTP pyrophosphatase MutT (NUDIX family)
MADDGSTAQPEEPQQPKRRRRRRRRGPRKDTASGAAASGAPAEQPAADPPKAGSRSRRKRRPSSAKKAAAGSGQPSAAQGTGRKGASGTRKGQKKNPAPRLPTTREISAGGVVYRRVPDGIEVVLASRRTRRGELAWGLAKGGIETGETREQAAIREVREETGLTAEIEADLGDTKYMYVWEDVRIRKTVHFFLMRHTGGDVDDRDDEMEEIRWFPLERALKRAAYRGERDVLTRAAELLG